MSNCCISFCVIIAIVFQVVGCFLGEIRLLVHISDNKFDEITLGIGLVLNLVGFLNGLVLFFGAVLRQPKLVLAHLTISGTVTVPYVIYILVEILNSGLSSDTLPAALLGYVLMLFIVAGFFRAIYLYYNEIQADYDTGDKEELVVNESV